MPTYDYFCNDCGEFDAIRSMSSRNDPAICPTCSSVSERVFLNAPRLACLSNSDRTAHATNERARHEPKRSGDSAGGSYSRLKHPSGCGCCSTSARGATVTAPNGAKTFPSKRPWMISH